MHPTIAFVDINAIKNNVRRFKTHIGKAVQFCAVLKADGYGHGAIPVARAALAAGADCLAVAFIPEALELRYAGITAPILVLGYLPAEDYAMAVKHDLTVTLMTKACAAALNETARRLHKPVKIHIKINTGMNRLGVHYELAAQFVKTLNQMEFLQICGIYSHFSKADESNLAYTLQQLTRFNQALADIATTGIDVGVKHICNSAGTLNVPDAHLDMVRVGISLYGYYPSEFTLRTVDLQPAMSLRSVVSQIIDCAPGEEISYGGMYVTDRPTKLAVIPIGYADGFMRAQSNQACALLHGKRVRQVGRICMDQCMFDITDIDNVKIDDEIILFGDELPVEEVAERLHTINYEIVCAISKRVPRKYI
ncbi:MAG: alanine racemase [Negativicutes bacterium]|jgi:alanine racemase